MPYSGQIHYNLKDVLGSHVVAGSLPNDRSLTKLREMGVMKIYCLLEEEDCSFHGITLERLLTAYEKNGFRVRSHPIPDMGVPREATIEAIMTEMANDIRNERPFFVHCLAGWGRTGTILACLLVKEAGHTPDDAVELLRRRCAGSVQNEAQEDFVTGFAASLG